jgi:hypothetical protein
MRRIVRPAALVEAYFDNLTQPQQLAVRALRDLVLEAVPPLEQTVLWGDLAFMVQGRNLLSIGAHTSYAALRLSNGALLTQEFPELQGAGKGMRMLKLPYGSSIDSERVKAVVQACYDLARSAGGGRGPQA